MGERNVVLLTGATGFVGSNLARRLLAEGNAVHILTRPSSNKWRIADVVGELNEHCVDLLEREKLAAVVKEIKPDVIFHTAALGVFGGVQPEPEKLVQNNFIATMNLIDACKAIDYACFVNTGSSSEYGKKEKPMRESDMCEPVDAYGITKGAATMYGQMAAKRDNKPIIGLRLFSPYGPFDDARRLISYATVNALRNKPISVANKLAVRDYVFVEDVVDLYIKAIGRAAKFGGMVFNVGSGKQAKISDVVERIVRLAKSSSAVNWGSKPSSAEPRHWQADISKTSKCFNWKPRHGLESGLKKTVKWFSGNLRYYE